MDYWTVMRMNSLQPRTRIGMNFTNKMLRKKKKSDMEECMRWDSMDIKHKARQMIWKTGW